MGKLKLLEEIFQKSRNKKSPVNNLQDINNLKVLVWTFSKTGTSTLASSFQKSIDGTSLYKNVTHSHWEVCWYRYISPELKKTDFSFELLIEFINSKGIHPLVVQSYRCPVERVLSELNHLGVEDYTNHAQSGHLGGEYIDYLKKTFTGIWTHNYDKERGFGFHRGDKYDILYLTCENIDRLSENIKSIKELKEYHNLTIDKQNVRSGNEKYEKFKDNIAFGRDYINDLYDIHSEPLNFFYIEEKLLEMKENMINKYA
tara:strand:- start:4012 stop:4785 length:774 start_codon:yes stop_codon:yes gene_type:complete